MFSNFFPKNRAIYDTMWENSTVTQGTGGKKVQRMRFACWIPKPTDTHSEYVILIVFPLQQWLGKRVSMLRNQCIACLVFF